MCDAVCTLPADRIDVCHMGGENNYWTRASEEEAAGSLCGQKGATCNSVCWFDARAALKLSPGAWLVRWRVRTHRSVGETFTLRTEAGEEDKARVTVTPVPAALHSRAPPAGNWELEWKGPAGGEAPQPSADAEWSPDERDVPDGAPEWQHLPVAVVHVKAAAAGASGDSRALVWAAVEKHDACWVGGLTIDCLQAVPLAGPAAAFAPLPLPPVGAYGTGTEVFQGLPVEAAPTDRWEGPHWATRQVE